MSPTMLRDRFNQQSLGVPLNTMVKEVSRHRILPQAALLSLTGPSASSSPIPSIFSASAVWHGGFRSRRSF